MPLHRANSATSSQCRCRAFLASCAVWAFAAIGGVPVCTAWESEESVLTLVAAGEEASEQRGVALGPDTAGDGDLGAYHALIIGIDDYAAWPRLRFAQRDAGAIRDILISRYGFKREHVVYLEGEEASRSNILNELRRLLETLGEDDNLLIYYAGHGQLDPLTGTGFWIPFEGDLTDETSWVRFSTLKEYLTAEAVRARDVALVTDSCYGGAMRAGRTPGHPDPDELGAEGYEQRLKEMAHKPSRQIIASGGFEQVPDRSDFARLLKGALRDNPYPIVDLEYLFYTKVYPELKASGQQEPVMARLIGGPGFDGQFLLAQGTEVAVPAPAPPSPPVEPGPPTEPARLTVRSNVYGDQVYIDGQAKGSTRLDLALPPGHYAIRVEKEGYEPYEERVELTSGTAMTVRAQLKRIALPPPRILSFEASSFRLRRGQSATLSWRVEDADSVEITGLGTLPMSGSRPVTPSRTIRYVLSARNRDGASVRSELQLFVDVPVAISAFEALPATIAHGETTTLRWATQNAQDAQISDLGQVPLSGSREVGPKETTSYTLVARDASGQTARESIRVLVETPAPAVTMFQADPPNIDAGQRTRLRWRVENAARVEITDIGSVPSSGARIVSPSKTRRYGLTAVNDQGKRAREIVVVRVAEPVFAGLSRVRFRLPGDGVKNRNERIGPFCCTGETVTVPTRSGYPAGYVYFFDFPGGGKRVGSRSVARNFAVGVSGLASLNDPKSKQIQQWARFTADELRRGASKTARAGGLEYKVGIQDAETTSLGGKTYYYMDSVKIVVGVRAE